MHSLLLNFAFLGCAISAQAIASDSNGNTFELCTVARDQESDVVSRRVSRGSATLLVKLPPVLSSHDLKRAKAVTKSSWSILSGGHRSSSLVLTLKPEAVLQFQKAIDSAIRRDERLAIVLHGEVLGILLVQHSIPGEDFEIDGSFFSQGTPEEKERETQTLAREINSTLR